jgi:hypothetical protein
MQYEILHTCREVAATLCDSGPDEMEFTAQVAAYWLATDFHGGQGTELYEFLGQSTYRPGALECGPGVGSVDEMVYQEVAEQLRLSNS